MFDNAKMIENIKKLCNENNVKISDLEEEVGLSKGNLSRWAKSCPSAIEILIKISEKFNVPVDYILNINYMENNESGKNSTLNQLIMQTEEEVVVWEKLTYTKSKKIPVVNSINELVYNSNILLYETVFNGYHMIFVHYNDTNINKLFIENNNEYIIISDNDSYSERLYFSINNKKYRILNDFLNM